MLHKGLSARALLLFLSLLILIAVAQDFRCTACQQVVDRGYQLDGRFYCPNCLNEALPKCYNCGAPIQGNYVAVSHRKLPVCMSCRDSLPQCFLCSMPCDGNHGGLALADGRFTCGDHSKGGVTNQGRARQIFQQARKELGRTFSGALEIKTPIKEVLLVDINGLSQAALKSGHNPSLSGGKVLGIATVVLVSDGNRTTMKPSTVHLLNHVPEARMLTVSTHEYAHVWHAENHRDYTKTQPILREGFAEWVAYKVAQSYGRQEQMDLMLNTNGGVYYQGLLKFLQLERERGVSGVLQFATTANTI